MTVRGNIWTGDVVLEWESRPAKSRPAKYWRRTARKCRQKYQGGRRSYNPPSPRTFVEQIQLHRIIILCSFFKDFNAQLFSPDENPVSSPGLPSILP